MTTAPTPHLRALAEAVKGWASCNEAWPHAEHFDVAVVGGITEGEQYPIAQIDADTYGTDGESLKLAQFYAAANPGAVLALLDRIDALQAENERLRADQAQAMSEASSLAMSLFRKHYSSDQEYASGAVKFGLCDELRGVISQIDNMSTGLTRAALEARKPLPLSVERLDELWASQRSFHGGEPLKMGHVEFARLIEVEYGILGRIPMREENGGQIDHSLIASREVVADGPVRITRLHLSAEGRAALTTTATGPLPGITGRSS